VSNSEVGKLAAAWVQQLRAGNPDPALTDQLAAQLADAGSTVSGALLDVLQHHQGYGAGTSESGESNALVDWEEMARLEEAGLAAVNGSFPSFNLSFLQTSSPPHWAAEQVESALRQGGQWIQDTIQSLYILLSPPTSQAPGLAVRGPLASFSLEADQGFGWEVEVLAEADGEAAGMCRVEVGVFRPEGALDNVEVTIRYGEEWQVAATDSSGVVLFNDVPAAALNQVVVHVRTPET
jgi:hypothetical protein